MMRCPSCRALQPDDEQICLKCGELLTLPPEALERVEQYRLSTHTELLCVMFCDVSGFTGISARSLPQSQQILALHLALMQALIERDGAGEIVNTAGDGVLAVFANPATATECALALHAAAHRYTHGGLAEDALAAVLQPAGIRLAPEADEVPYQIHIGLHLGIVTRGGRTSRDIFGHNVNVACRLCSLAGPGQTYLSDPVYENARLILGDRHEIKWQVWKEYPLRGVATPITVVGVAFPPFSVIHPPKSLTRIFWRPLMTRYAAIWIPVVILVAVLLGGMAGQWIASRNPLPAPLPPTTAPAATTTEVTAPAQTDEVPPLTAVTTEPSEAPPPTVADANGATPTTPAADTAGTAAAGTPTAVPPSGRSTSEPPPASGLTPPTPAAEAAELAHQREAWLKGASALQFSEGVTTLPGFINLVRSRDGQTFMLVAGLEGKVEPQAAMALVLDGNNDGKLSSQATAPYGDVLLSCGGPDAKPDSQRYQALLNGQPGAGLLVASGVSAQAFALGNRTVWAFHVPYHELGVVSGATIKFQLRYWPSGATGPLYQHPNGTESRQFRYLIIP
ncbi:MAG TPA: adenylate/guanylate cyclase domain-containing protein [Armatimonadota bacterium]|jgi:class 3 adenylate cyclase